MTDDRKKNIQDLRPELTKLAQNVAAHLDYTLDFSVDSLSHVDDILLKMHDDYTKTKEEQGLTGIALEFASYIIDVLEKDGRTGVWTRSLNELQGETFPFRLGNGQIIFPYQWCLKRIFEGESESIVAKYSVLTEY
jgi:hypothetical protein